jgi:hypothetical protein
VGSLRRWQEEQCTEDVPQQVAQEGPSHTLRWKEQRFSGDEVSDEMFRDVSAYVCAWACVRMIAGCSNKEQWPKF